MKNLIISVAVLASSLSLAHDNLVVGPGASLKPVVQAAAVVASVHPNLVVGPGASLTQPHVTAVTISRPRRPGEEHNLSPAFFTHYTR
jgi:hypothetical protein